VAQRTSLPPAVTSAVELIEARITGLQRPAEGNEDFNSGMIFGLREAEACLMQALVSEGRTAG
jgi:hypothetical protein